MFKRHFSGHNTILGGTKIFGGHCSRIPHRGYGPVGRQLCLSRWSRPGNIQLENVFYSCQRSASLVYCK